MITIGIAGGTGAGKSTFVKQVQYQLQKISVAVLPQDAYYHANTELSLVERKAKNYDHPDAIDWELLHAHIVQLQSGNTIMQPVYSMLDCCRTEQVVTVSSAQIILVEGILIFTQPSIRNLFDLKIFIDANTSDRYDRVLQRDMQRRGRDAQQVEKRFSETVQPMHAEFIEPTKSFADIIVSGGGKNAAGLNTVVQTIKQRLTD